MLSTQMMANPWSPDGAISPRENRLFIRENATRPVNGPGPGSAIIEEFQFHVGAGRIGKLKSTIALDQISGLYWGLDQMVIHPKGKKLYVSGLALPEVRVFDTNTGVLLKTIKTPPIKPTSLLTGITVVGPPTKD